MISEEEVGEGRWKGVDYLIEDEIEGVVEELVSFCTEVASAEREVCEGRRKGVDTLVERIAKARWVTVDWRLSTF